MRSPPPSSTLLGGREERRGELWNRRSLSSILLMGREGVFGPLRRPLVRRPFGGDATPMPPTPGAGCPLVRLLVFDADQSLPRRRPPEGSAGWRGP